MLGLAVGLLSLLHAAPASVASAHVATTRADVLRAVMVQQQDGMQQDDGMQQGGGTKDDGGMQDGGMQDGGTKDGGTQDGGMQDGGMGGGGGGMDDGMGDRQDARLRPDVKVTVRVRPETVVVGQPFTMEVRARVPRGTVLQFPMPQAGGDVDTAGKPERRDTVIGDEMESVMTYKVAAWRTGPLPFALGYLTLDMPDGAFADSIGAKVVVKSVLPKDKAKQIPKAPRPMFNLPLVARVKALVKKSAPVLLPLLALGLVALGVLVWLRRRKPVAERGVPLEWAEREFQRVEAMRLIDQGQTEQHAILMAEVVRQYLTRRYPEVRTSATTTELAGVLRSVVAGGAPELPADRVVRLFTGIDMLKFARAPMTADEAKAAGTESRAIVRVIADHRPPDIAPGTSDNPTAPKKALGRAA